MAAAFKLQPGDGGPRYDGPHGPVTIPADQSPEATRLVTPRGDAELAWGMLSRDGDALRDGVPARISGRELVLRRDGRRLVLQDAAGSPVALARRKAFGRVEVSRPDGTLLGSFKPSLAGEVEAAAGPDDVALLMLLMASGAAGQLERRVPLLGLA